MLSAVVKALNLQGIGDQVAVGVVIEGIGAQAVLGDVQQAIVVGVHAWFAVAARVSGRRRQRRLAGLQGVGVRW